ncbi:high affinity immunoglobulin epsilon receptor subunit gamma [Microcaecilia unicolor]|uniref:high affinity immunoglobulin epsilon receptor subunit gamma n=1 Tax=Microcaecilia unicolor TaxID=1415580 RepID=UPI0011872EE7|nr:high affinity immunoglobulin epsilon receptor subunit gamma [Microcaecilia unicolor]
MRTCLLAIVLILLNAVEAEALREPEICYVLDAILFVYGIILTVLYCRLKLQNRKAAERQAPQNLYEQLHHGDKQVYHEIPFKEIELEKSGKAAEGVYTGLSTRSQETYETLHQSEKPT